MLALPIARRELLVLSRAAATWRGRLGTSGLVFIFGIVFALMYHYGGQMALTQAMRLIGVGLALMCLFTGVPLTADSIAEEKRQGTLGLLFLTHQSSFQIVLGKLVAHGVAGFYTVMCALPLLSMSMIFGGMRFVDVLLSVFAALNILFFSAAVGLLASSICREKKRASTLGMLILMLFWQGFAIVALMLRGTRAPQWIIDVAAHLSLNLSHLSGFGVASLLPSTSVWWQVAWPQIAGWAFLVFSAWWLPRHWQDEPPRKRRRFRELWNTLSLGTPTTRLKLRRKLLDRNPFLWLASRDRLQTLAVWIVTAFLLLVFGVQFSFSMIPIPHVITVLAVALAFVLQVTFSAAAGAQLFREYEQGTLELVLSTPLSTDDVIKGQLAAAVRQFRTLFTLLGLLLCGSVLLLALSGASLNLMVALIVTVYSALLLLQFHALGWMGMWCVTKATELKQPRRVSSNAFFFIVMLPGIILGGIIVSVQFVRWLLSIALPSVFAGLPFSPGPRLLLSLFFVLAFANTIYWLRRAKRELPQELRLFAFRRYTPREPVTLFGEIGKLAGRLWRRLGAQEKRAIAARLIQ